MMRKKEHNMKKINLGMAITLLLLIQGCGVSDTAIENEIDKSRGFDLWDYMTSPLNYEVEYDFYENGKKTDYYIEENRLFNEGTTFERKSISGSTTYYLNSRYILMKEPTREVEIHRYIKLGDNNVFIASNIENCRAEEFYPKYKIYNLTFNNVLMLSCLGKTGVKEKLYYGYSEGIITRYQEEKGDTREYVKVKEAQIFEKK